METVHDDTDHNKKHKSSNRIHKGYLHFLEAKIAWQADHDEDQFHFHMKSAITEYMKGVKANSFSELSLCFIFFMFIMCLLNIIFLHRFSDLTSHDARFACSVAAEYLKHAPLEPLSSTDPSNSYLHEATGILEEVCQRVGGSLDGNLMLAKCRYLSGDFHACESILTELQTMDSNHWPTHFLHTQLALQSHNHHESQASLDTVIGLNFQIQGTLLYHSIKARLLEHTGKVDDSVRLLESTIDKIRIYLEAKEHPTQTSSQKKSFLFSSYDSDPIALCINVVIQLAASYRATNKVDKAKHV